MFQNLQVFKTAYALATHAGARQAVIARNMANADTPGYRARDIPPFAESYAGGEAAGMRATRARHLSGAETGTWREVTPQAPADPNGNSVSLEGEILKAVEVKRQHDRAIAVYRASLSILRTSLGRG